MTNITGRPIYQKTAKKPKARKPMRRVSKKRAAKYKSDEGRAALAYMEAVKQLPCIICNAPPPSDVHHCIHGRYSAARASDFDVIPLCVHHHRHPYPEAIHSGKETWAAKHGPDYSYLPVVRKMVELLKKAVDLATWRR